MQVSRLFFLVTMIKQDEHVNKMQLNKRFSKKIQIAEDLNRTTIKRNIVVALRWNSNSET